MPTDTRRAQPTPAAGAPFAVGALVRVNESYSPWFGMTGRVELLADGWGAHIRLTSTGELRAFPFRNLVAVERGAR